MPRNPIMQKIRKETPEEINWELDLEFKIADCLETNDWTNLSDAEIEGIKAGLKDLKAGRTHSQGDVMTYMDAKLNQLKVKSKSQSGSKANILKGIKEAVEEVKLIREGKLKGIPARKLLK